MTFIGKLFVMLNLALSVLMAAVGFGVYMNNVDWHDTKGGPGQPPGRIKDLTAKIKEAEASANIADYSYRAARADLFAREDARLDDRLWYEAELKKLQAEKAVAGVSAVATDKGLPRLVDRGPDKGRPLMVPQKYGEVDLGTYTSYANAVEQLRKEVVAEQNNLKARQEEDQRLTVEKIGNLEMQMRGLTRKITEERVKRAGILDELGIVKGLQINVEVESELIYKRLDTIDERVKELTRYLKRKHGVEVSPVWR